MKRYLSNYLGIVIQNNDPEQRGRVKVWVPHISTVIYENWNKDCSLINSNGSLNDKYFNFVDKENNPDIDNVLSYLKESLPWAEVALSIFGGSASGRYKSFTRSGTTSDSNANIPGFRPLQNYIGDNKISDAFPNNPNRYNYIPSDYSNMARGEFTIPNVGAHVWVFFIDGDSNYPVIWAVSHGEEDWKRIYSNNRDEDTISPDYPASYENLDKDATVQNPNHNINTFRSKHVFNSNKHSIELIDTDKTEILKFTHYSGSFLEFNNATTSRLATNNDQLMVIGDQYVTVNRNQNLFVANNQEISVHGDRIITLGDFNEVNNISKKIFNILKEIHEYKRLFNIKRSTKVINHTSTLQTQVGKFATCPICNGSGEIFGDSCIVCNGTGDSPSTQWGKWDIEQSFSSLIIEKQLEISALEALLGTGNDDIGLIAGNKVTTIGTVFNNLPNYRIDMIGKLRASGIHIAPKGAYVKMSASPLIETVDIDSVPGGDWNVVVGNKFTLNVGAKGIQMKTVGSIDMHGSIININSEAMYLGANTEMIIDARKRIEIESDNIELKPKEQVLVSGSLGVAGNIKTLGGLHIEGELSYISSTAPKQLYMTEIGYGPVPHTHIYYGPKCEWTEDETEVRSKARSLNSKFPSPNSKSWGVRIPS